MKVLVTKTLKKIVSMRYENGALNVVANCFLSQKRLKGIIQENIEWIRERRQEDSSLEKTVNCEELTSAMQTTQEDDMVKGVFSGRKTILMGDVVEVVPSVSVRTYFEQNTLYISEKQFHNRDTRLKAIKIYLKKMASLYVSSEIADFGSSISLCPIKIEFKDISETNWLKCSMAAQRVISIDYRIVQLPENLRKYIIAHAFAHFFNPIHDGKFWNCMSNVLPNYQDYAKQLEYYSFLKDI